MLGVDDGMLEPVTQEIVVGKMRQHIVGRLINHLFSQPARFRNVAESDNDSKNLILLVVDQRRAKREWVEVSNS